MADIFFLAVECGTEIADAERMDAHFRGIFTTLSTGTRTVLDAYVAQGDEGYWTSVCGSGVSRSGA